MTTLIAFLLERMAVSLPDILFGGVGGYLVGRRSGLGIGILALYGVVVAGSFMGPSAGHNYIAPVFGGLSAVGMAWLATSRRKKRAAARPAE